LRIEQLAGLPHAVHWQGLFIDANLRVAAAVPRTGADAERVRGFFELTALEGSVQEHRLFEEEFSVAAMSTAKLIGLAQASGVKLLTLDGTNVAALLPSLGFDDQISADIVDAIARGQVVHVPAAMVQHSAWSGIGYLKENRVTGEAGYMLSGGLAGGQTILGRRDWPEELAAMMAQPFVGEPNADPAEAFSITAVTPSAIREATAGEPLDGTLMALVRDAQGRAVAGAPVIFSVRTGGGWLVDDQFTPARPGPAAAELATGRGDLVCPRLLLRRQRRQHKLPGAGRCRLDGGRDPQRRRRPRRPDRPLAAAAARSGKTAAGLHRPGRTDL
jgi:hypothetical protein